MLPLPVSDQVETACQPTPQRLGWEPSRIYAVLGSVFGPIFALALPPTLAPDESTHFARAYHISEGHLFPQKLPAWGGAEIPVSIQCLIWHFQPWKFHPEDRVEGRDFEKMWELTLDANDRRRDCFWCAGSLYPFVPYLPQASAIAVTRALGLRPLVMFYAARLANVGAGTFLIWLAIRITPIMKLVFCMVGLIPVMAQQIASVSPDATIYGAALLLLAAIFHLVVESGEVSRYLVVVFGTSAFLTVSKFPYALLALNYWAIPRKRFDSRRRYYGVGLGLIVLIGVLVAASGSYARRYIPSEHTLPGYPVHPALQLQAMRNDPLGFLKICLDTIIFNGRFWLDTMFLLGKVDAPMNGWVIEGFLVLLIVVALADHSEAVPVPATLITTGLVIAGLCVGVVLSFEYQMWTPDGAPLIRGTQGRHLLPCLPLLLLPCASGALQFRGNPLLLRKLVAAGCAGTLFVALVTFAHRYYYPGYSVFLSATLPVGGFVVVVLLVVTWGRWKRRWLVQPAYAPTRAGRS